MPAGCVERQRLLADHEGSCDWRKWGPYLSERQWGTVREDYSEDGDAWSYFSHDQSRSRTYHWGEDGLAGISDDKQQLCFAMAFWNGVDPILKERLFGLTNSEGNHGDDVKEYYYYLDATPTHSYLKWLYKYPQKAYPYDNLVKTNRQRGRLDFEYELMDTGVFDDDRYWDIQVEYAKAAPEDILILITLNNRGLDAATIDVLPTLWFRNTWTWWPELGNPKLSVVGSGCITAEHPQLGTRWLYFDPEAPVLFTGNETNNVRIFGRPNTTPFVKDAFHRYLINGEKSAVNSAATGTKCAVHARVTVGAGQSQTVRLRLSDVSPEKVGKPFDGFDATMLCRRDEADEFYKTITPDGLDADRANVMRQAYAGMIWSKQFYFFDALRWLQEHGGGPFGDSTRSLRNQEWPHMVNSHVISMPDKWEYPWYAAWDLAFHSIIFSGIDIDFAKQQLNLMLHELYLHPSGQLPAYEWNFSDVNPPVHAWATLFLYRTEEATTGKGDVDFLKRAFARLLTYFTWWLNRKDRYGNNAFQGGFLGLDNIGVFDRSAPLPNGGCLEQADGTAWMSLFCHNMLEIAVELTHYDPTYEDLAAKFLDHFLWIAYAINCNGSMWDEEDGFYYDLLRLPDGRTEQLKVRSVVGILPMFATTVYEFTTRATVPKLVAQWKDRALRMPQLIESVHPTGIGHLGVNGRGLFSLVNEEKLRRILSRVLDENEFFSPYGLRAVSRYHKDHPYVFDANGTDYTVKYAPAESDTGMFGGNSNWRGPIWAPMNVMLFRALLQFYEYYGDNFKIECPTGSGKMMNLFQVAQELAGRFQNIFLKDASGKRPVFGGSKKFQTDPHWRDHLFFYEYFHGDNGAGLGASHQTGWTGLVAPMTQFLGSMKAEDFLAVGKSAIYAHEW